MLPDTVRLQVDRPAANFDSTVKSDSNGSKLTSKSPELDRILSGNVNIPSRQLGELLGVSHETANKLKNEWLEQHKPKQPEKKLLPEGTLISKAEAEEMKESLRAALVDEFRYLDEYLASRLKNTHPDEEFMPIWDNLDDEELDKLTRLMIKGGQHNPAMATVARSVINARDYVVTIGIVGPRAKKTFDLVRATHRAPTRRGAQNANQH